MLCSGRVVLCPLYPSAVHGRYFFMVFLLRQVISVLTKVVAVLGADSLVAVPVARPTTHYPLPNTHPDSTGRSSWVFVAAR